MAQALQRFPTAAIGQSIALALLAATAILCLQAQTHPLTWIPPSPERAWSAATILVLYVGLCAWRIYATARKKERAAAAAAGAEDAQTDLLVAYASQTGFAEHLAEQTVDSLKAAGVRTAVMPLATLDAASLIKAGRALFVLSTTGEGDPPDSVAAFARQVMNGLPELPQLQYGLLALGDREYRNYCGFGRQFDRWLRQRGAQPLFEPVEVDNGDASALETWRHNLSLLAGKALTTQWRTPTFDRWRLIDRTLANPQSVGAPTFYLSFAPLTGIAGLEPIAGKLAWRAGDIAEIRPHHPIARVVEFLETAGLDGREPAQIDGRGMTIAEVAARSVLPASMSSRDPQTLAQTLQALPKRDFSIASVPEEGRLDLLVRQARFENGKLGLATGWLTEHAWVGAEIELRIRANPGFQAPTDDRPMILIGNGTGLAGLRSLLKTRALRNHTCNWLIFGERNAAHDFYYRTDIEEWQANGALPRLDLAFSRDREQRVYVQHKLLEARDEVRGWIEDGAAVYICGSIDGMATGVEDALIDIIGKDALHRLNDEGRYRRDVY